jgi:drug/metabolite transporter (DMT)-like permease
MTETLARPPGDNVGRGMALALTVMLIFATQDAISKYLVQADVSPFQMTMMRFWAFGGFALLLAWRRGGVGPALRSRRPGLQVARAALLVFDIWLFVLALDEVSLAAAQAITLVYPLLVTLFAIPLLGERVGVFRIVAVLAGLMGALVIIRPGGVPLGWGVLFAIGSGATYALYIVLTRKVSQYDSTVTSLAYTGVVGLVISSAVGVFFWAPLEPGALLLIGCTMVTGILGHGMMIYALSMAPASVLQPFNYTALPWGIMFGIVIFHETLDLVSLLGAAIIVGAGLVVMARERVRRVPTVSVGDALPGKE